MAPATRSRQRIGWTMRRARTTTALPLQVIQENTLIKDARSTESTTSSSAASHFSQSPPKEATRPLRTDTNASLHRNTNHVDAKKHSKSTVNASKARGDVVVKSSRNKRAKATTITTERQTKPLSEWTLEEKQAATLKMLDELEQQLAARKRTILEDAARRADDLKMELKVQLMFLPNDVRRMQWKSFIEDYDGSLANVIQTVKEHEYHQYLSSSSSSQSHSQSQSSSQGIGSPPSALRIRTAPATVRSKEKKRTRSPDLNVPTLELGLTTPNAAARPSESAFQTPLWTPVQHGEPRTVMRTARKGETTFSARGSPILPETVVKAPRGSLVATFGDDSADDVTCLTLDDDVALDLSNPDNLSDEYKQQAAIKLEALQAKVTAMLQRLK